MSRLSRIISILSIHFRRLVDTCGMTWPWLRVTGFTLIRWGCGASCFERGERRKGSITKESLSVHCNSLTQSCVMSLCLCYVLLVFPKLFSGLSFLHFLHLSTAFPLTLYTYSAPPWISAYPIHKRFVSIVSCRNVMRCMMHCVLHCVAGKCIYCNICIYL